MAKISIIVPVYNVEQYLEKCINSLLNQTYTNFEVILVDDGSTDLSGSICDKYSLLDRRVSVIHKCNGGLSSARNAGLSSSTGDFIGFVDSDDWISNDMYEYLYSLIIKSNADVVSADYFKSDGAFSDFHNSYQEKIITGSTDILKYFFSSDIMNQNNDYPVWNKLYKRELFSNTYFPEGKIYEDIVMNYRILQKCNIYVKSTKHVYAYYQRPMSITKSKLMFKHLSLIDVSKQILQSLCKNDSELIALGRRKVAMSYFSILAMYIRNGTDLENHEIERILSEYKKIKYDYLSTERSIKIRIISFFMCLDIFLFRRLYSLFY